MKEERRAKRLIKSSSRLSDEWGDDDDCDYQPPKEPGPEMPLPTQFSSTTSSSDSQATAPSPPPVFDSQGFPVSSPQILETTSFNDSFAHIPQCDNAAEHGKCCLSPEENGNSKQYHDSRSGVGPAITAERARSAGGEPASLDSVIRTTSRSAHQSDTSSLPSIRSTRSNHRETGNVSRPLGRAQSASEAPTPSKTTSPVLRAQSAREPHAAPHGAAKPQNSQRPFKDSESIQKTQEPQNPQRPITRGRSMESARESQSQQRPVMYTRSTGSTREPPTPQRSNSQTPQRPVGNAREPQTPRGRIDSSSGLQRSESSTQRLSGGPPSKRQVATIKPNPNSIARHQTSQPPPRRMDHASSVGSLGVSSVPPPKVQDGRSSLASVERSKSGAAPQRSQHDRQSRPTVGKASSIPRKSHNVKTH